LEGINRILQLIGVYSSLKNGCKIRINLDLCHLIIDVNLRLMKDVLAIDWILPRLFDDWGNHI
jgi:hypothetical protein